MSIWWSGLSFDLHSFTARANQSSNKFPFAISNSTTRPTERARGWRNQLGERIIYTKEIFSCFLSRHPSFMIYRPSPIFLLPFFFYFISQNIKKSSKCEWDCRFYRAPRFLSFFILSLLFKNGFFSFRFCCCTTFLSIPKEKNQKRISAAGHLIFPIRWWWWCISLFTARSSFFLLPNTFEILIWKKGISCARSKNLCITFAQDVSLPPHRQELIMKQ